MKDYQVRMMDEYNTLASRYIKLNTIINKYEEGILDFVPNCPIELLKEQSDIMWDYIDVLQRRSAYEDMDLGLVSKGEIC